MLHSTYTAIGSEYNMLMSSLRVSVSKHLLDEYFTVVWANDYFYEKTGYSKEEYETAYHNHCSEYFQQLPTEYAKIADAVHTALAKGEPGYALVCKMPHKDGTFVWIKVVGTFTDETLDGVPVIYAVFTDISDLIQTQMEQSVTYDNLPGFVAKFRVDASARFHFVGANERFIRFFGERGPDDPPYSLVNVDNERNRRAIAENRARLLSGQRAHFVVQVKDSEGEDAWLQINADCVDWVRGDPVYLVVYIDITDITEQRELQKKLEERSEMLRNALEMAERANRAKSDFLSRMSHDIRTPMNAIMGMIAIAKESPEDPRRVLDCLGKVETSANFLLALINDILDMSKIESGKMVLRKKAFDFAGFIRNLTTMFYAQAQKRGIRFQVTAEGDLQDAYIGDELKLNQILINLLGNALKFTDPGGGVDFSVSAGKRTGHSRELVFRVRDSGIGMDPAFMDKLFLPFEQDGRQRENRGGSGLGLAIAGNYARMMNGEISVESAPDAGSTFTVKVWLESVCAPSRPVDLRHRFEHLKALVADPDPRTRDYTASLLRRFGLKARTAASSGEALSLLDEAAAGNAPFTLLLIDCKAPFAEGITLARSVRERFGEEAPLMAAAAYDWGSIRSEAEEAGISGFLQKPLFPSTVYDFLISATQDRPVDAAASVETAFAGETVLLVEDNDINLEIAQTLLESRNLHVESARNGREAVECFAKAEPGRYLAILMDIQMPIMDGLAAACHIRALPKEDAADVPIIAMSANAFEDDAERSLEAGMDAHISKPIDISLLFKSLQALRH